MRTLPYLALLAGLGLVGFATARLSGGPALPRVAAAPARPKALEDAWRAHLAGRTDDLDRALATLADAPPEDGAARAEVALLTACASKDEQALALLAEGRGPVAAGAQHWLALQAQAGEVRRRWAERFLREFPGSSLRSDVEASVRPVRK